MEISGKRALQMKLVQGSYFRTAIDLSEERSDIRRLRSSSGPRLSFPRFCQIEIKLATTQDDGGRFVYEIANLAILPINQSIDSRCLWFWVSRHIIGHPFTLIEFKFQLFIAPCS